MQTSDITAIIQLIQAWGLYRDQGRWRELADTFTPDGTISVTWFSGAIGDFVAASKRSFKQTAPRSKHLIGVPVVQVRQDRAIAETNVQILGRAQFGSVHADMTSHARFLDRLVRTPQGWRILRRIAIYEKDRLDPVSPVSDDPLRGVDLSGIPEPYRYLGHMLKNSGRTLQSGILCDGSPAAQRALAEARTWLCRDSYQS